MASERARAREAQAQERWREMHRLRDRDIANRNFAKNIHGPAPYLHRDWNVPAIVPEQGARAKVEVIVPMRNENRGASSRPMPLPWGAGDSGPVIDNDPSGQREWYRRNGVDVDSQHYRDWQNAQSIAKHAKRWVKRVDQIAKAVSALEQLEHMKRYAQNDYPGVKIAGWSMCDGQYGPPFPNADGIHIRWGVLDCAKGQITGQGYSGPFVGLGDMTSGDSITLSAPDGVNQVMPQWGRPDGYGAEQSSWTRNPSNASNSATITFSRAVSAFSNEVNPNLARHLAPDLQPMPNPVYPDPAQRPFLPQTWPQQAASQMPAALAPYAASVPVAHAFTGSARGPGKPITPTKRRWPEGRTRERKTLSKFAQLGIGVYKALDTVSEWGDVVDAIYEALPPDVRKRWDRPDRRGVDQFGQYGANGADWKLKALWHNWHRLDTEQAVKNIAKNALEDALYGAIHKRLPKQAGGPGMEDAWKEFHKRVMKPIEDTLDP